MAEPRRIENRWTWQGLLQLVIIVFGIGGAYSAIQNSAAAIPPLVLKVEQNTLKISRLESRAEYEDKVSTEILRRLERIENKLDDKADRP